MKLIFMLSALMAGLCFGGERVVTYMDGDVELEGFLVTPEKAEAEMTEHKVDWELVKYGGAVHAFTQPMAGDDPGKGVAYDKRADVRSWARMRDFLASVFGE